MDLLFMRLTQMAFGYWQAQPMFLLAKFKICDHLEKKPKTANELAQEIGLHPEVCAGVLNASVALKLIKKDNDHYFNTELTDRFFRSDSSETLVHWLMVMARWMKPWADLDQVLLTGKPAEPQGLRLGEDPEYLRDFILGMHEYARKYSKQFAESVNLQGQKKLIDVGGGAGTYSIALCNANTSLQASILDLEPVLSITQEVIDQYNLSHRITTKVANYHYDPFGEEADVVLLSNILHQESIEVCRSILDRAYKALNVGGQLIVQNQFLGEDRTSPLFATLHNLSAWALWNGGKSYTVDELQSVITEAGFVNLRLVYMKDNAESLLIANRP